MMRWFDSRIGSALFTTGFYSWSIFLGLALIPTLVLPRAVLRAGVRLWVRGIAVMLRALAGVRVEIRGRENVPQGAAIVASKHQSEWEANVFNEILHDPVYVIKKELGWIPLYGLYARKMKMIFIDRAGRAKTIKQIIAQGRERAARGRPLVIFPEGTRVAAGERIPYQTGVAGLYAQLDLPVVPVVHNSGLHWPKKTYRKYPGAIVIEFLPAIPPGLPKREFMARLETTMESAWERLYAEKSGQNIEIIRQNLKDSGECWAREHRT
jgi:1-acyl-sn-glycerol-3-phosphate acyltransferase